MGLRGPQKKSNTIKLLAGTSRPDRMIDPLVIDGEMFSELPMCPVAFERQASQAEWDRLGPVLVRCKMLNAGNLAAFAMMCQDFGSALEGDDKAASRYQRWVSDFGLTPASRGRVKTQTASDEKPKGFNRFQRAA